MLIVNMLLHVLRPLSFLQMRDERDEDGLTHAH